MEKKLINQYPAANWTEASPVGNGRLGAAVYGRIYDERILINHEYLYNWAQNREIPDVSAELAEVRRLMDEKRYAEAEQHYTKRLQEAGFQARKGKFYPAFDLHLLFGVEDAFADYAREIDMENGVCTLSYTENGVRCLRRVYASQVDGCLVLDVEKSEPFAITVALEPHDFADYVGFTRFDGDFHTEARDGYVYAHCRTDGHLLYSGLVRVLATDGTVYCGDTEKSPKIDMGGVSSLKNGVTVTGATRATFLLDVAGEAKSFEEMRKTLDAVAGTPDELLQRHAEAFSAIFNRTRLSLCEGAENESVEALMLKSYGGTVDPRLSEKMADYGRYLLISSACGGTYPPNLQGVWNGDYSPAWACTFFNNENIQMNYWQAFAGGLADTALPLFDLYESFMDDYRHNAKRLFGCRGILLPLFMDNRSGKKDNLQPHVLYWTASSAWISAIYFDYYLYTGDTKFLLERAYPFMKEAALFYEDFMVYDEAGRLKSYPSDSPENRADGDYEGARTLSVSINATMDFAILKELLINLISVSEAFALDEEARARWSKMLEAIPPYEINEDGAMKEWLHPDFRDNYHHRHQSHIYPLFPGFEITEESDKELFDAMKVAVEKRLCIGLKEQTGWSFAHMANIYARLGDGARAKECLDLLIRFCTGANLWTHHNDWRHMGVTVQYFHGGRAPFQIDANMGFTAAVYEMLLYSDHDKIKLLPALPAEWRCGKIENIHARGGYTVTLRWDETEIAAEITAAWDGAIHVKAASGAVLITEDERLTESSYGERFRLLTLKKNESITLRYGRERSNP